MIIDEVVLHDFGPYRGRQELCLTPKSAKRPVVLVGGMNGGGKTTLLDGLQLALYGQRATCSNRNGLAYDKYLASAINRSALPSEGASVEVALRHRDVDGETRLRVNRSWRDTGRGVRERVEVWRDGKVDDHLSETWNDRVETILPPRLAHLFFFDGEQVESLADLSQSQSLLESALNALLGLDRVTRLDADLKVLERRRRSDLRDSASELEALRAAEQEADAARRRRIEAGEELGRLRTERAGVASRLRRLESKLKRQGGALLEKRGALEAARERLEGELRSANDALVHEAAGLAPLLLTRKLLRRAAKQAALESDARMAEQMIGVLEDHDRKLVEWLEGRGGQDLSIEAAKHLEAERNHRAEAVSVASYIGAGQEAVDESATLLRSELPMAMKRARRFLKRAAKTTASLDGIDRDLQTIPPEDRVAELLEERAMLRRRDEELCTKATRAEEEHAKAVRLVERSERKVQRMMDTKVRADFEQEDVRRLIQYSQKSRKTLGEFRNLVASHHIERIAALAHEGLQFLLHKDRLVSGLRIDPHTCAVDVLGPDRRPVPADRLSAGERQLLAISLLWGLARASGQALPTIIDTPLGRLDSKHREHLVERYFPHASHQVVLLSTDEEIDARFYSSIRKWVGREYVLEHQPDDQSTSVREGYFWSE